MNGNTHNMRPTGVMVPPDQLSPGTGTPKTLVRAFEMQSWAVEYVDDSGKAHRDVFQRVGGIWHKPPNGENYASQLRALSKDSWLSKALEDQFQSAQPAVAANIPNEDAVDPVEDR